MEVQFVPGHMRVAKNKKTDEAAKEMTKRPGTRKCPERFASLAHVGKPIMELKWKQAKHWFKLKQNR